MIPNLDETASSRRIITRTILNLSRRIGHYEFTKGKKKEKEKYSIKKYLEKKRAKFIKFFFVALKLYNNINLEIECWTH